MKNNSKKKALTILTTSSLSKIKGGSADASEDWIMEDLGGA